MTPPPILLQHPGAAAHARVSLVSVEPASAPGMVLVRIATGPTRRQLGGGTAYGPFPEGEAAARLQQVVERLMGAGYAEIGEHAELLNKLTVNSRKQRALATANLGWRGVTAAVPALLDAAAQATTELPIIVDALGRIGDARAIPLCREQAAKKLLSRRRSGVEALRALGDAEGLAHARVAGLQRLPEAIVSLLGKLDESAASGAPVDELQAAVMALEPLRRGLAIDQLYEFATPLCVAVARHCLAQEWETPHLWRYTKSVWKRAQLREDFETFAQLALAFERRRGRTVGIRAELKSGLDGQSRKTPVFAPRTQDYVVRASARWLYRLAWWRRASYVHAATAVLARYDETDAREPEHLRGAFAWSLMLHRLLHAAGPRFHETASARVAARNPAAVSAPWSIDHVAFADRWEQLPTSYLRLAAFGRLDEVRAFGEAGLLRHPAVLAEADGATLAALVDVPVAALALLAEHEIERRFDAERPDLSLCAELLDGGERARTLGRRLLALAEAGWIVDLAGVLMLLQRRSLEGRAAATQSVLDAMPRLDGSTRRALLALLLDALEAAPETSSALVDVLLAHADEAAAARNLEQILAWIQDGDLSRRTVGGALLGAHPDALATLGTARLVALADDEVQSVRAAACLLVGRALDALRDDPWPLLTLAETRFPDTRRCAFELLGKLDIEHLGHDALVALCDSNHAQVQDYARRWIGAHLERLDGARLLECLIEHPHAPMRAFALELLERHLPDGAPAFARVQDFLRASLLTPRLARPAKDRLLRVVAARGVVDAEQGRIAITILGAALRTAIQRDFEPLVLALTRIQLAWPALGSEWRLAGTGT